MLLIDNRAGSHTLHPLLVKLGAPAELGRLAFGDVHFHGRGPGGDWIPIGVEYKSLPDVLACITTGRYAGHQLGGMAKDYAVSWLLIQGLWRPDPATGVLMRRRGAEWIPITIGGRRYMGRDLDKYLLSITQLSGVRIHKVSSDLEAAMWLKALYTWWTEKTWEQHASLHTFDLSGPQVDLEEPDITRRIAKELPGVGWVKSAAVAQHFGSALAMAVATEREWREVPGIGPTLARRIVRAWQGEEGE